MPTRLVPNSAIILILFTLFSDLAHAESKSDYERTGAFSHYFNYKISFYPARLGSEDHLIATLKNISGKKLQVAGVGKLFDASLIIKSSGGRNYEAYDKEYLRLLLHGSVISFGSDALDVGETIRWNVPLRRLRTLHGRRLTSESLSGATIVSELDLAVVPKNGTYSGGNAQQTSKPIRIPKKKKLIKFQIATPT